MIVRSTRLKIMFLTWILLISLPAVGGEFYSQTVYLYKFHNPITQNKLTLTKDFGKYELFGGVWFDFDNKTDAQDAFTDAQFAPLIGARSKVFGPDWLLSRLSIEGRLVHRITPFPDDRKRSAYELRPGILGYGLRFLDEKFFFENYYALFYSQLYNKKIIFQGWSRQGFRLHEHFDLFNEVFADTFDQTRERDGTLDLRPGSRFVLNFSGGNVQLIHQFLYHFTNLQNAGRSEQRSTLVLGLYW